VDNGAVVTAAGISAGIDVSLHLVARLAGREVARRTADYMEYRWLDDAGGDRSDSPPT
jgi:transcriptional regulator GlxA family with amidase domain